MPNWLASTALAAVVVLCPRAANAACVLHGARPTAPLPTMTNGQEFSFVASADCAALRFTIRGSTLTKVPKGGMPVGPGPRTYHVVLTEPEWNDVVAGAGASLTWIVSGTGSDGVRTRLETTNALDLDDGVTVDLSLADAKFLGEPGLGDFAGTSLSDVGDVDGDGNDDLLIGAPGNDEGGGGAGAAYLLLGPIVGIVESSDAEAKLMGAESGDYVGQQSGVSGAGDVNGDGLADLLLGASNNDRAYLVLGPVSGELDLSFADATLLGESSADEAGWSVSDAGDIDADGNADVLIGTGSSSSHGVAYLVHGPITGNFDLGLADATLATETPVVGDGTSVSDAGDVNGDGNADLLIGAPYDSESAAAAGAAYVVTGPVAGTFDLTGADAKFLGEAARDIAGYSVSPAGDVDGDGNDDVWIGSLNDDGGREAGAAYLVSGPARGTHDLSEADAKLNGRAGEWASFGALAGAGDVDGDGHADLLVGATGMADGGRLAGGAYLVRGPVRGTYDLATADVRLIGEMSMDSAGISVAIAGDFDGDGFDDAVVGASNNDEADDNAGAAYILYGAGI